MTKEERREYNRKYREEHKEYFKEYFKKWQEEKRSKTPRVKKEKPIKPKRIPKTAEEKKASRSRYWKEYYAKNKDKILAKNHKHYEEHKELYSEHYKKWRGNHPDRIKEYNENRRQRYLENPEYRRRKAEYARTHNKPRPKKVIIPPIDTEEESWKDVVGFEGLYMISNIERIWSYKSGKYMVGYTYPSGYRAVSLRKDGKTVTKYRHIMKKDAFGY